MLWSQKVSRGDNNVLRFTENKGGPGNSSAPRDVNAFSTTNFQSRFATRGDKNHGNTRRDGRTRIPSILALDHYILHSDKAPFLV